jgi:hypothetical protein
VLITLTASATSIVSIQMVLAPKTAKQLHVI